MAIADWTYEGDTTYCIPSIQSSGGNPGGCILYDIDATSSTPPVSGGYYRNVTIPSGYDKYMLSFDIYPYWPTGPGKNIFLYIVKINDIKIYEWDVYERINAWSTITGDISNAITVDASNKIHIGWECRSTNNAIIDMKIDNVKIIGLNQI